MEALGRSAAARLVGLGVAIAGGIEPSTSENGISIFSILPARRVVVRAAEYCDQDGAVVVGSDEVAGELRQGLMGPLAEQMTVGAALGYSTGFFVKKAGRVVMGIVGAQIVALQYMAAKGWVVVNWSRVAGDLGPSMDKSMFTAFVNLLTYRLPFSSSFTAGMYYALRNTK